MSQNVPANTTEEKHAGVDKACWLDTSPASAQLSATFSLVLDLDIT